MNSEQRLIEIESKIAYQEDLIQTLNDVVYQQQEKIAQLEAKDRKLMERLQSLGESRNNEHEDKPPPHY
ncbi:MAG: SlyX family protein [Pseudomonadales bacterium]